MLRLKESAAGDTMRTNTVDDVTSNSRNVTDIHSRQRSIEDSSGNETDNEATCDCGASDRRHHRKGNNADDGTCDSIEDIPLSNSLRCGSSSAINASDGGGGGGGDTDSSGGGCNTSPETGYRNSGGYLIAVHRKLSRQDTYFLSYHKTRPSLFGVPLLIPCYENGTNKGLYCAVWQQVARLLSPLPSTPNDQSNHATDW